MTHIKRIKLTELEEQEYAFLPILPEKLEKPSWQTSCQQFVYKSPSERFKEIQKKNAEFLANLNKLNAESNLKPKWGSNDRAPSKRKMQSIERMKEVSEKRKRFRKALVELIFNQEERPGDAPRPKDDQATLRYRYYIENGIDTRNVGEMKEGWFERMLEKLTFKLKRDRNETLMGLLREIMELYNFSCKKATVDFVLQNFSFRPVVGKSSEEFFADKPWRKSLRSAFLSIRENLHLTSRCLNDLTHLWINGQHSQQRLIRKSDFHSLQKALTLETFKDLCSRHMEECISHLENEWMEEVCKVFARASQKGRVPRLSESTATHESFFACVSSLMTRQLQQLTLNSLQDYVELLVQPQTSKRAHEHPGLVLNLTLEGVSVGYEPNFEEFKSALVSVLDEMVGRSRTVRRVECRLYADWETSRDSKKCLLLPIALPEILYSHKIGVARLVARERAGPERQARNFDQYSDLISKKAELEVAEFLEGEHSFEEYCAQVEKFKSLSDNIKYKSTMVIRTGMFEVHCEELVRSLSTRANALCKRLLDRMVRDHNAINRRLELEYHSISEKALTKPADTSELMDLVSFIRDSVETTIPRLSVGLGEAMGRLIYLIDRTDLSVEDVEVNSMLFSWAERTEFVLREHRRIADEASRRFIEALEVRKTKLAEELQGYSSLVEEFATFGEVTEVEKYLGKARSLDAKLRAALKKMEDINYEENAYDLPKTSYPIRERVASTLEPYHQLYEATYEFNNKHEFWMNGPMKEVDPESVVRDVEDLSRTFVRLEKHFISDSEPKKIAFKGKTRVDAFKVHLPTVVTLFNPGLRDRHWKQVSEIVQVPIDPGREGGGIGNSDGDGEGGLTLAKLINLDIDPASFPLLEAVSEAATKEHGLEKALDKMKAEWQEMEFTIVAYRETGTFVLSSVDDVQILLDDHAVKTEAMMASAHAKPFEGDLREWSSKLALLLEILDQWLRVQATWLYMEPIFGSQDIVQQMPEEGRKFNVVDKNWRSIMKTVNEDRKVMNVLDIENLLQKLKKSNETLELVQKGLNDYLERKRFYFPRFFFLSNEEILEILSETKDPTRVQPHLKKCFEGIASLAFGPAPKLDVTHVRSSEGESVELCEVVSTSKVRGQVEKWLLELERVMLASVRKVIKESIEDYAVKPRKAWVLDWPGQAVLCASLFHWTAAVHEAMAEGGRGNPGALKELLGLINGQIEDIVQLVRGHLSEQNRTTLRALIVLDVHSRDVTSELAERGTTSEEDFSWTSQLRYYQSDRGGRKGEAGEAGGIVVRMINCSLDYGYEYLGNTSRLVITPLTDRCYRTLFGALDLHLGGAPEGPAGTGKTETTKDLARAVAKQCVVFNCSDGLDHLALGKFFKGLASCGAWSCFDEFNRIDIEVLSVVAQQILTIQMAINSGVEKFTFEGSEIKLNPTCSVFITMNPGYAGRSELPDNLKALFRPVAMMVPDYTLISEISLYSEGFTRAKSLAVKVVATYKLCSEQLSTQPHYDYGMRAVKSVLLAAGKLKRQHPDEDEDLLVLRSIEDVNLPKFNRHDLPLFRGIVDDLFPTAGSRGGGGPGGDPLREAVLEACRDLNLEGVGYFVEKVIQIYKTMLVRHGLMIVGGPSGGKTTAYRVLARALGKLHEKNLMNETSVEYTIINPKSMTSGQLYGEFDPVSREWIDGALSVVYRNYASSSTPDRKWIVFDGPVDAIWIENMNTVLDDNKKLCLASGEVVRLAPTTHLVFETLHLEAASPATVSRCGMIYLEPEMLGWRPAFGSWLRLLPSTLTSLQRTTLEEMFGRFVDPCLALLSGIKELCPTPLISLVSSLTNLMERQMAEWWSEDFQSSKEEEGISWIEGCFLFSLVWSLGSTCDTDGRTRFDALVRHLSQAGTTEEMRASLGMDELVPAPSRDLRVPLPRTGSLYDYQFVRKGMGEWHKWSEGLNSSTGELNSLPDDRVGGVIVPTVETLRFNHLARLLIGSSKVPLFVGPTGTGKTSYILDFLQKNKTSKWLKIQLSSRTTANSVQNSFMLSVDRRKKATYGPSAGRKMVAFVDDLGAPLPEKYGAQPPIELLRQFLDHGHWFDLKEATPIRLVDVHLIGAMGTSGTNRISPRFMRHCSVISVGDFDDLTLKTIYRTVLDSHFVSRGFSGEFRSLVDPLVLGTLDVYKEARRAFLPTPGKPHYSFNLRDFDRVARGMRLSVPEAIDGADVMKRLWLHEITRVFNDRLVDDDDRLCLFDITRTATSKHLRTSLEDLLLRARGGKKKTGRRASKTPRSVEGEEEEEEERFGMGEGNLRGKGENGGMATPEDLRGLVFCDFMDPKAESKNYSEVGNVESLGSVVEKYLEEYNNFGRRAAMDLVLFGFAVEHVSRISRIIKQPGGHALLVGVGGSGRRSLARLAGYMADYEVAQVEVTKGYSPSDWQSDLKTILRKTIDGHVMFLLSDTQIKHESFIEDVTNLLNSGEVPNLFQPDEKTEICEKVKAIDRQRDKAEQTDGTPESLFDLFVQVCRDRLHVVLTFSPVGDSFRCRVRDFPSLVNCCTVDWFESWPGDALQAVAVRSLGGSGLFDHGELKRVIPICRRFHLDVVELSKLYLEQLKRYNYVTPTSYLELLGTLKNLYERKKREVNQSQRRYETGLERLRMTTEEVASTKHELGMLQPKLVESGAEVAEIMKDIERESQGLAEVEKTVRVDEAVADEQARAAKEIKVECNRDLSYAMPALEAAIRALNTITQNDISVIKAMKNPPPGVRLIMEAVCILQGSRPDRVPDLSTGKMTEDYWKPSLRLLGDIKFMESLINYDKDNIPPSVMKQIRQKYCSNPEFDPNKINKVSSACEGLCKWVLAMDKYDSAAKIVAPKKEALKLANEKLSKANADLKEKRESLRKVQEKLNDLKDNLDRQKRKKLDLENKAEMCTRKISRAEQLISALGGERERWFHCIRDLEGFKVNLLGDVLVSSAIISYLGAFTPNFRQNQTKEWSSLVRDQGIGCSEGFSLMATLGDPLVIRSWMDDQLPTDEYSIQNGIIVANTRRWPLVIDPQDQFSRFVRNSERENNVRIVAATSPDLLRSLENCMQFGTPMLLEGVDEWLDPVLDPILRKETSKQPSGGLCIRLGDSSVEYNPDFRLYITTRIRNPHFLPETSVKVTLINFATTAEGLEDQLLGLVVSAEMPKLEETKRSLVVEGARNRKQLADLENKILEVLESAGSDLLEDETAIQVLSSSERLAYEIKEKQAATEATEASIDKAREQYRSVAGRATVLFFTVSDLASIEGVYQYSLGWFVRLYLASVDGAERFPRSSRDATAWDSEDSGPLDDEEGRAIVAKRSEALKGHFALSLYRNVCRSLFEKDKLLFSFLLATNLLRSEGEISDEDWRFFLLGGSRGGSRSAAGRENTLVSKPASWLPSAAWNEICSLDRLENFSGLRKSFFASADDWKAVHDSQQPHSEKFPMEFEAKLKPFQRLLIVRALRPDRVILGATDFVARTLGEEFTRPPVFDLEESFKDSSPTSPLVLVLSPGSDPVSGLLLFGEAKGFGPKRFSSLSLGRGQGPIGARLIEKASADGNWVLLQNCHLAPSWMPSLERIVENLEPGKVHEDFRLWLTTYPCPDFPASLLQNGVKATCEPAEGLKDNLTSLLGSEPVREVDFWEKSVDRNKTEWKRMVFGLVCFHALVQERRSYGPIGWNVHYEFNESDFRISLQRLKTVFKQYKEVQYDALLYMTGECDYGGRVTDHWDRRTLTTLLRRFYGPPGQSERGRGGAGDLGFVGMDGDVEYESIVEQVRNLPATSDPGFFGLHENASISRNMANTRRLFSSLLLTQTDILTSSGKRNSFEHAMQPAKEILDRMSALSLDVEGASKKYPTNREQSMNTVLIQEMVRFNCLLDVIKSSLADVMRAIQGQIVMTPELEEVVQSVMTGKIPEAWKRKSFPSLKPLGSYVDDLVDRLQFIGDWAEHGPPATYWISGFFFTQAFLTGVQQNYARKHSIAVDLVAFDYEIMEDLDYDRPPDDGAFVRGLYIEGARWDSKARVLCESEPKVLHEEMPTIWIKPCPRENLIQSGTYAAPVYKTGERKGRLSTTGHSTNFVTVISIPSSQPEEHWIERGVALLCQLDD